jgi:hypothetical protein
MHRNVEYHIIGKKLSARRVSKPSIFFLTYEPKALMVCIDAFKLQTMSAFNQKLLRMLYGVRMFHGGGFFKKRPPLAAGDIMRRGG